MKQREIIIAVGLVCVLGLAAASNYREARERARVSDTHAAMKDMRTALTAYRSEHQAYPPQVPLADFAALRPPSGTPRRTKPYWTPLQMQGGMAMSAVSPVLTTPVAYLPQLPLDPLANIGGETALPFAYHVYASTTTQRTDAGWMLISPGLDGDYDLTDPAAFYRPAEQYIALDLERLTLNPTRAAEGKINGDTWLTDLSREDFERLAPWDWD